MTADGSAPRGRDAVAELRSHISTGNARPVLHEIHAALANLLASGKATVIDLGAIPFAPGDERLLDSVLGPGEVSATIHALGETRVQETGIAGVWRVDHFDESGETVSRFVEITFMPEILKSQRADAEAALATLAARLDRADAPTH
jgi:hydrogenase-1 operon protein HyaF